MQANYCRDYRQHNSADHPYQASTENTAPYLECVPILPIVLRLQADTKYDPGDH